MKYILIFVLGFLSFSTKSMLAQQPQYKRTFEFGGNFRGHIARCIQDSIGNYYIVGSFTGRMDYDQGPKQKVLHCSGSEDMFITKLDSQGNSLWGVRVGGRQYEAPKDVDIDEKGNLIVTGLFQGTVDFDPSSGSKPLKAAGAYDAFICRYSAYDGSCLQAFRIGASGSTIGTRISGLKKNGILVVGTFDGSADFDPGPGSYSLSNTTGKPQQSWICSLDSSGSLQFASSLSNGTLNSILISDAKTDQDKNFYLCGNFKGSCDFDLGSGITNVTATGNDGFFAKYNSSGGLAFVKKISSSTQIEFRHLEVSIDKKVLFVAGILRAETDFDPDADTFLLSPKPSNYANWFLSGFNTSNGGLIWAKSLGYMKQVNVSAFSLGPDTSLLLTGVFYDSADFTPGVPGDLFYYKNSDNLFISSYSHTQGTFKEAKVMYGDLDGFLPSFVKYQFKPRVIGVFGSLLRPPDFDQDSFKVDHGRIGKSGTFVALLNGSFQYRYSIFWDNFYTAGRCQYILPLKNGDFMTGGIYEDFIDLDLADDTALATGWNEVDAFMCRYDVNNKLVWKANTTSSSYDLGGLAAIDINENIIIGQPFLDRIDADFLTGKVIYNTVKSSVRGNLIAKYNTTEGKLLWSKVIDNGLGVNINDMETDKHGNFYITGGFYGSLNFDSSSVGNVRTSQGQNDIFLAKYDSSGKLKWVNAFGSSHDGQYGRKINIHNDTIHLTGYFKETVDFDPSTKTNSLQSSSANAVFIATYNQNGNFIWARKILPGLSPSGYLNTQEALTTENGEYAIAGTFEGSIYPDSENPTYKITAGGNYATDLILLKYNSSGKFLSYYSTNSPRHEYMTSALLVDTIMYLAGAFLDSSALNFTAQKPIYKSLGANDVFFASYSINSGKPIWNTTIGGPETEGVSLMRKAGNNIYLGWDSRGVVGSLEDSTKPFSSGHVNPRYLISVYEHPCIVPSPPLNTSPTSAMGICKNESTVISAKGKGTLFWYDRPLGGNLLHKGHSFSTASLFRDTAFYVADSTCVFSTTRTKIAIEVFELPKVEIQIPLVICSNKATTLQASGAKNYVWNGIQSGSTFSKKFSVTQEVFLQGTDSFGCMDTDTASIHPLHIDRQLTKQDSLLAAEQDSGSYTWINCANDSVVHKGNTRLFRPKKNGYYKVIIERSDCADTSDCVNYSFYTNGVWNHTQQEFFNIFPNPTDGRINIYCREMFAISVWNSAGQLVQILEPKNTVSMDIFQCMLTSPGVYIVRISSRHGEYVSKIVCSN